MSACLENEDFPRQGVDPSKAVSQNFLTPALLCVRGEVTDALQSTFVCHPSLLKFFPTAKAQPGLTDHEFNPVRFEGSGCRTRRSRPDMLEVTLRPRIAVERSEVHQTLCVEWETMRGATGRCRRLRCQRMAAYCEDRQSSKQQECYRPHARAVAYLGKQRRDLDGAPDGETRSRLNDQTIAASQHLLMVRVDKRFPLTADWSACLPPACLGNIIRCDFRSLERKSRPAAGFLLFAFPKEVDGAGRPPT